MTADRPVQDPVIHLDRLTLRYGQTLALDDVSLAVSAGGILGLIGPDGVGKSSLLALIAGARKLQEGHGRDQAGRHELAGIVALVIASLTTLMRSTFAL